MYRKLLWIKNGQFFHYCYIVVIYIFHFSHFTFHFSLFTIHFSHFTFHFSMFEFEFSKKEQRTRIKCTENDLNKKWWILSQLLYSSDIHFSLLSIRIRIKNSYSIRNTKNHWYKVRVRFDGSYLAIRS